MVFPCRFFTSSAKNGKRVCHRVLFAHSGGEVTQVVSSHGAPCSASHPGVSSLGATMSTVGKLKRVCRRLVRPGSGGEVTPRSVIAWSSMLGMQIDTRVCRHIVFPGPRRPAVFAHGGPFSIWKMTIDVFVCCLHAQSEKRAGVSPRGDSSFG